MDDPPPITGEIVRIDDVDTGFSPTNPKTGRPYVVVGPAAGRRLALRPLSRDSGKVHVPEDEVEGLEESWVVNVHVTVPVAVAAAAETVGRVPSPLLDEIRAMSKR